MCGDCKEKLVHTTQVFVLLQMQYQHAEEITPLEQEICCILALVEKQQETFERIKYCKTSIRWRTSSPCHLKSMPDKMRNEIFNLTPVIVNMRLGAVLYIVIWDPSWSLWKI